MGIIVKILIFYLLRGTELHGRLEVMSLPRYYFSTPRSRRQKGDVGNYIAKTASKQPRARRDNQIRCTEILEKLARRG